MTRADLLELFKARTGGRVTIEAPRVNDDPRALLGYQPARVKAYSGGDNDQ